MRRVLLISSSTFFAVILTGSCACADRLVRPGLKNSMSYYDVVKLWGPPKEKLELESKREDVWIYDDNKVIFSQGKVVAWMPLGEAGRNNNVIVQAERDKESVTIEGFGELVIDDRDRGSEAGEQEQVEQILKDLMDEPES